MAQRKRSQPAALRRYWAARRAKTNPARRRRRAKRNYATAGVIANPRRRRRSRARRYSPAMRRLTGRKYGTNPRRRRHYRRNPGINAGMTIMGVKLPPIDAVLFTGAGFIVPPIVSGLIMGYLPDTWKTSKMTYYGVKVASVIVPSMLVRKFVSPRAGNLMLLGGAVSFALDMLREFAPGLMPLPAVAGMGFQPFLGQYQRAPYSRKLGRYYGGGADMGGQGGQFSNLTSATPERLQPQGRF